MQADSAEQYSLEPSSPIIGVTSGLIDSAALEGYPPDHKSHDEQEPARFHGAFASCMEMYADAATVAHYLDLHRDWFPRCALPMATDPIDANGYALTIGRFGSFGYEIEPKIGLNLLPQDQGIYRIQTIPIPDYHPPGYAVDFQAALQLVEISPDETLAKSLRKSGLAQVPDQITQVEWELDLQVMIQFPRFIQALPKSLVQTTGDKLLNEIVRQVSRRLTYKVQQDFHTTANIPFPKKHRKLWQRDSHPATPSIDP
ncbi:MAG: DUF1997 domain-containing protein [Elainella sp. Prado103]|jgi:hypothetical protein|nr:DUF1997 domain-containing protein [Elainella sp. Prado103]